MNVARSPEEADLQAQAWTHGAMFERDTASFTESSTPMPSQVFLPTDDVAAETPAPPSADEEAPDSAA